MANKDRRRIDWEGLYAKGEMRGPGGMRAETANGTAYATGRGWNRVFDYSMPEVPVAPVWPDGKSNRTGE